MLRVSERIGREQQPFPSVLGQASVIGDQKGRKMVDLVATVAPLATNMEGETQEAEASTEEGSWSQFEALRANRGGPTDRQILQDFETAIGICFERDKRLVGVQGAGIGV